MATVKRLYLGDANDRDALANVVFSPFPWPFHRWLRHSNRGHGYFSPWHQHIWHILLLLNYNRSNIIITVINYKIRKM